MSFVHVKAIFTIQLKDTLKNIQILILFFIYPFIGYVMATGMPEQPISFISLFATMHVVFTPIVAIVTILSEQKDKKILHSLMFSNVTSAEYIISNGLFVFIFTILSSLLFFLTTSLPIFEFLLVITMGSFISILIGASIALHSKNISSANAISIPIAMVLSFLPMLATFNAGIEKFSNWLYSQQCANLLMQNYQQIELLSIFAFNFMIFLCLLIVVYKRSKKEEA